MLRGYVVRNRNPGYAQGLNYIGKFLLAATEDEERAFWLLNAYVEDVMPPDFLSRPPSGMNGFMVLLGVFKRLGLEALLPVARDAVGGHVLESYIEILLQQWAVTALVDAVPLPAMLVVWRHLFAPQQEPLHPCISGKFAPFVAALATLDTLLQEDPQSSLRDIKEGAARMTAEGMARGMRALEERLKANGGVEALNALCYAERGRLAAKWSRYANRRAANVRLVSGALLSSIEGHHRK